MAGTAGQQVSDTSFAHSPSTASLPQHDLALYTSSQASSSSSSLLDPANSERSSVSARHDHDSAFSPKPASLGPGSVSIHRSDRSGPGIASSSQGFCCPNCGKAFARDDLLRRHLAREARALAQPSFDRQKSCYECARSKARCDLEVPSCGRCRARGKHCAYAPRTGNPNVRKARNLGMMSSGQSSPSHAASSLSSFSTTGAGLPAGHFVNDGSGGPPWAMSPSPYYANTPGLVKREGELDYDSTSENEYSRSWNQSHGAPFRLNRTLSVSSGSVESSIGSPRRPFSLTEVPDSAPASMTHFGVTSGLSADFAPPIRTESPHSYTDVAMTGASRPVPGAMHGSGARSSGFSRTSTNSIVTNLNRQAPRYANEEGEETPIVRVTNSFSEATALGARGSATATAPGGAMMSFSPGSRQRTASLPVGGDGPSGVDDSEMPEVWNVKTSTQPAGPASASRFVQQHGVAAGSMMPPVQPPTLVTSNLGRGHWPVPSPARPTLFTSGLDLSGWLEEPVVPSPLFRVGAGVQSSLMGAFPSMAGSLQSPIVETPVSARFTASLAQFMGNHGMASGSSAPEMPAAMAPPSGPGPSAADEASGPNRSYSDPVGTVARLRIGLDGRPASQGPPLPNAEQYWSTPEQSGEVKAGIAQLSAAFLVSLPAAMGSKDSGSPIPLSVHRRWVSHYLSQCPSSYANARVVLSGYLARLPASSSFVWHLIAEQIKTNIATAAALVRSDSDLVEAYSVMSALWVFLVIIVFTEDADCTDHVDAELLDSGLCALSDVARSVSAKLVRMHGDGELHGGGSATADFDRFCRDESLVRALYQVYSLLVLQRFRENGDALRSKLAGRDLVLSLPLPCSAAEFEADTEVEWRSQRAKAGETLRKTGCTVQRPTLCQLDLARKQRNSLATDDTAWVHGWFESQDAFGHLMLSIAFALDTDEM